MWCLLPWSSPSWPFHFRYFLLLEAGMTRGRQRIMVVLVVYPIQPRPVLIQPPDHLFQPPPQSNLGRCRRPFSVLLIVSLTLACRQAGIGVGACRGVSLLRHFYPRNDRRRQSSQYDASRYSTFDGQAYFFPGFMWSLRASRLKVTETQGPFLDLTCRSSRPLL